MTDRDKAQNKGEELKGKAKKKAGDLTDNEQWQAEGKAEQAKGNLKQAGEKVKDALGGGNKGKSKGHDEGDAA